MEFGVHLPHIGPWHDGGAAHVVFEPAIMAGIDGALAAMERFAKELRGEFG